MSQTEVNPPPFDPGPRTEGPPAKGGTVRLYSHSAIIYWWIVWLPGFVISALTYLYGETVTLSNGDMLAIAPSEWIGGAFLLITISAIIFTNFRIEVNTFLIVVLTGAVLYLLLIQSGFILSTDFIDHLPKIYMSLGFYLVSSTAIFLIWIIAFFISDRLTHWEFSPGYMQEKYLILNKTDRNISTLQMNISQKPMDIMRRILSFGTMGDIYISFPNSNDIKLENVMFARRRVQEIKSVVYSRPPGAS